MNFDIWRDWCQYIVISFEEYDKNIQLIYILMILC